MHNDHDNEFRHWKLLLSAMLGAGATGIPTYTIGLLVSPISAEFGWTRTQITFAITLTAACTMLLSPLAGRLVDLYGVRRIALPAVCITSVSLALLGLVQSYNWYVGQWILIGIAGGFCSPVVWTVAVANRFVRNRGLALAITLSGIGLVGTIMPLLAAWLIQNFGWRLTYAGLSVYVLGIVVPLAFLYFRVEPSDDKSARNEAERAVVAKPGLTLKQTLRIREFWILAGSFLLAASAVMSSVMHFVPILTDAGLNPFSAAGALSVLSTSAVIGRLGCGWLLDRLFAPHVGVVMLFLPVFACLGMASGATQGVLPYVYAVLVGLAVGAEFDLASYLTARYFGLKNFATIYGLLFMVFSIGITFGPIAISLLYDYGGGYDVSLKVLAATFFGAALLLLLCRKYPEFQTAEVSSSSAVEQRR